MLCFCAFPRRLLPAPGAIGSPTWSCFSSAPYPQLFYLVWGFRTCPLSLMLPQTHSLPALFSPRFGDDIPGMEGLGTDITVICPWEAFSHLELHELAQFGII
uniref:Retinal cone rhodopsin-sensitive cGMP 3',5'-cyclic phosphodiesterase subunit gamma n=1 Tax=Ficedula albicollis TaxID=59894 RepID=A0A803V8W0_FICAL